MIFFGIKYKKETDENLMILIQKGDSKAFSELYDRYSIPLLNFFHRMLWKDKEKAEDFMQDLFTKLFQKPSQFDPSKKFKTWLYSSANNMCKNEYRKNGIHSDLSGYVEEFVKESHETEEPFLDAVDSKTFNDILYKELDYLNENQKACFLLRYRDELSIKDISEIMNVSEGTVKSRLFYTLRKLAQKLKIFEPLKIL
jgi:RNA polymerase sigma factor (sigma-70 family)